MYCVHCGSELPDNAKFCTECGASVQPEVKRADLPSQQNGTLRVSRQSSMIASAMKTKVYVDGDLKITITDGQSSAFQLLPGAHVVELRTTGNKGITRTVEILPGSETVLQFKLSISVKDHHEVLGIYNQSPQEQETVQNAPMFVSVPSPVTRENPSGRVCPRCGGSMSIQTVSEGRKSGCLTVILYIVLALTILGLLIVIPLVLRKKTETVTYAVCQKCGYKKVLSRTR